MSWLAEIGGAVGYGLAWIVVIILSILAVITLIGGNFVVGGVSILLVAAIWGGRKLYRRKRPARQSL